MASETADAAAPTRRLKSLARSSASLGGLLNNVRVWQILARLLLGGIMLGSAYALLTDPDGLTEPLERAAQGGSGMWLNFWSDLVLPHQYGFSYLIGAIELVIAFGVLLGLLRKAIYLVGMVLGVFLWSVPEAFAGLQSSVPLANSAGLMFILVFLLLATLDTAFGPGRYTLDDLLEHRWPQWARLSEFRGPIESIPPPSYMLALLPALDSREDASGGAGWPPRPNADDAADAFAVGGLGSVAGEMGPRSQDTISQRRARR